MRNIAPSRLGARLLLPLILLLALGLRLYHLRAPIADTLATKQVFTANKARAIARPPWAPLRDTLDILDDSGRPMHLVEEIPAYIGLLSLGYRAFGEHDWIGRALSILGSLAAVGFLYDVVRRERDSLTGLVAAFLLAIAPLSIFYGRAVMPDSWMLALMLAAASSYGRYLDTGRRRWLLTAALAGLAAAAFKYYGLIVLVPLADMARRRCGLRALRRPAFLILGAAMVLPVAFWMVAVFAKAPNPVSAGWLPGQKALPYLAIQAPSILLRRELYAAFFSRFLARDCGPVTAVLLVAGVVAASRRRVRSDWLLGWTAMGLLFYFGFGPKLIDHDYYELMMLPAALGWAAVGWTALFRGRLAARRGAGIGATVLIAAGAIQSPWVMGSMFHLETGKLIVAGRLRAMTEPAARVVAMGPGIGFPIVVHYAQREGWAVHSERLPERWHEMIDRYRGCGAEFLALYFDPKTTPDQRGSYEPLLASLPVVEHRSGPWGRKGERCEYVILRLQDSGRGPERWAGAGRDRR